MLDRMIKLKFFDEEIYMFIVSIDLLLGISLGLCIAGIVITIIFYHQ